MQSMPTNFSGYYIYLWNSFKFTATIQSYNWWQKWSKCMPKCVMCLRFELSTPSHTLEVISRCIPFIVQMVIFRVKDNFVERKKERAHTVIFILMFQLKMYESHLSTIPNRPSVCVCAFKFEMKKKYVWPGKRRYKRMYTTLHNTYYPLSEIHLTIKMNS